MRNGETSGLGCRFEEPASLNDVIAGLRASAAVKVRGCKAAAADFGAKSLWHSWLLGVLLMAAAFAGVVLAFWLLASVGKAAGDARLLSGTIGSSGVLWVSAFEGMARSGDLPAQVLAGLGVSAFSMASLVASVWLFFEIPARLWVRVSRRMAGMESGQGKHCCAPWRAFPAGCLALCAAALSVAALYSVGKAAAGVKGGAARERNEKVEQSALAHRLAQEQLAMSMEGGLSRFDSSRLADEKARVEYWRVLLPSLDKALYGLQQGIENLQGLDQAVLGTYSEKSRKDAELANQVKRRDNLVNALVASMDPDALDEAKWAASAMHTHERDFAQGKYLSARVSCVPMPDPEVLGSVSLGKAARGSLRAYGRIKDFESSYCMDFLFSGDVRSSVIHPLAENYVVDEMKNGKSVAKVLRPSMAELFRR